MALEDFRIRFGKGMNELILTAVLLLTIQLSVGSGSPAAPIAIGLVLAAIVYAGFPISGAHVNPAVSLSVFIRGKMSLHEMLMYWVFQLVGGVAGALLGYIIGGQKAYLHIGDGYHFTQAFLAEFVFTALLCFVVLGVATNSKTENNQYYGAAIGIVITGGAYCVGGISGAGFNPAVAIGLGSMKFFKGLAYILWVVVAELLGGIAGTAVFYIVAPDEFEHFSEEAHGLAAEARSLLQRGQDATAPTSA